MPILKNVVIEALEDLKALDIKILDVKGLTNITDWMVIATGTSTTHLKAIANNVVEKSKENSFKPIGIEGNTGNADWILIDLADVVVHVMLDNARNFYQLEKLWSLKTDEKSNDSQTLSA